MAYPLSTPIDEKADIATQSDADLELVRADIVAEQTKRKIESDAEATKADVEAHRDSLTNLTTHLTNNSLTLPVVQDTQDGAYCSLQFPVTTTTGVEQKFWAGNVLFFDETADGKVKGSKTAVDTVRFKGASAKAALTRLDEHLA